MDTTASDEAIEYTVILPEPDVIALAHGEVSPGVQNLAISCLKAMHDTPAFALRRMNEHAERTTRGKKKTA